MNLQKAAHLQFSLIINVKLCNSCIENIPVFFTYSQDLSFFNAYSGFSNPYQLI